MRRPLIFCVLIFCGFLNQTKGGDLSPEQIESLRLKLTQVKESLNGHISSRNSGARSTFLAASKNPRAALNLYLECYKKVKYDMEGRDESDFRVWKESQADKLKSKGFVQSLMIQLSYLALSCHAAEVEEIDEVFGSLNNYVESLSRLDELPDKVLTTNVSNSIFAEAYHLEKLLGKNEGWEPVPFNIPGIYDKTILPHIRANNPSSLLSAWDKRIEQQKRLVLFFESKKEQELRGMNRTEKNKKRNRQENQGGIMKSHDLEDFNRNTMPRLQWSRMKDMYLYIDQLGAAKAMLTFVEANLTTPNGEEFYNEFIGILTKAQAPTPEKPIL